MNGALTHRHTAVDSTQDEGHRLASEGATHGTAVVAAAQTGGRGTRGRPWVSLKGGLWLSVVCRPQDKGGIESLSLRAGLVLAELLERELPNGGLVALKWPNDLMIGSEKVGGILVEARWQGETISWIVIGVGLNVSNPVPGGLRLPATSLAEQGMRRSVDELIPAVVDAITRVSAQAPPLRAEELEAFRRRDWLFGRRLIAPRLGIANGIDAAGRLLIRAATGMVPVSAGTVELDPLG